MTNYQAFEQGFIKQATDEGVNPDFLQGYLAEIGTSMQKWAAAYDEIEATTNDPLYRYKLAHELLTLYPIAPGMEKSANDWWPQIVAFFKAHPEWLNSLKGAGGGGIIGALLGALTGHTGMGAMLGGLGGGALGYAGQLSGLPGFDAGSSPAASSEAGAASSEASPRPGQPGHVDPNYVDPEQSEVDSQPARNQEAIQQPGHSEYREPEMSTGTPVDQQPGTGTDTEMLLANSQPPPPSPTSPAWLARTRSQPLTSGTQQPGYHDPEAAVTQEQVHPAGQVARPTPALPGPEEMVTHQQMMPDSQKLSPAFNQRLGPGGNPLQPGLDLNVMKHLGKMKPLGQ